MTDTRSSEGERIAYCQNCGRPLTAADARNVGSAVFCEPCLVAKVAAADTAGASAGGSAAGGEAAGAAGYGGYGFAGTPSGGSYGYGGPMPPAPPRVSGAPNPGLAALLGFIPGVGAFYNGQYAKGVVHLVVFAVLTSLADRNGIFGLFVAGWIFYQVIEAHHTARARRDGTPLPNPFGLNDIGERLGFGRAWLASPPSTGAAEGASGADPFATGGTYVPPASAYAPPQPAYAPPPQPAYAPPQSTSTSYAPPVAGWGASAATYGNVPPPRTPEGFPYPAATGPLNRVPVGAIVLIGLGVLFLIGNSGWVNGFAVYKLIPFLLIGIGVWIFVRKMTEGDGGLAGDGTPAYRLRLFRAARGPVWIVLVGVLFLLDTFRILPWGRSWPLFIIVGGVMTFFERTAYAGVMPPPYAYAPPASTPVGEPVSPAATGAVSSHDQEDQ